MNSKWLLALAIGAIVAGLVISLPIKGLGYSGHAALALLAFAVVVWISETIPLPVSSLIILLVQPLAGIVSFGAAIAGFANPILFLLLGGFILAEGVKTSGLGDRMASAILSRLGKSSSSILLGVILLTGTLSAWINNLVAFALILPVVSKIILVEEPAAHGAVGKSNFAKRLILGASYGSLAGGLATEIGTGPNLIATAYVKLPFAKWMIFGLPLAFALMLVMWKGLMFIFPLHAEEAALRKSQEQSNPDRKTPVGRSERNALIILSVVIALLVTSPITGIDDYAVALVGAALFFLSGSMTWKQVEKGIDWGTLIFFGSALSVGNALFATGAADWAIGFVTAASGRAVSPLLIVLILMITATVLTQVVSNIGLAAVLVPIVATLANSMKLPAASLVIPAAVACSLSFMFPMSDPTIAMALGTGYLRSKDVFKAGLPITVVSVGIALLVIFSLLQFAI